jgi:hypothetical protein
MHFINNEIGDEEVSVDQPVDLEVVVVFAEWIDQSFGNLFIGFIDVLLDLYFIYFLDLITFYCICILFIFWI